MDELAKKGAYKARDKAIALRRPVYSTTVLGFYNNENQQIQNIRKHITYTLNAPQMIKYIDKKFNILYCIDDRPSVARMWRYELGLKVIQVGDPHQEF